MNASKQFLKPPAKPPLKIKQPPISPQFEKVVAFIQWSEIENSLLQKFQRLLQKQLRLSNQQLVLLLSPLKIDNQLTKNLFALASQIADNVQSFFTHDFFYYQANIKNKSLLKMNLLMRTSSIETKCICESIQFLHFVSCHMDQYNKIILWFQGKDIFEKLRLLNKDHQNEKNNAQENAKVKPDFACIIRQKVYSIISIIYIKYNMAGTKKAIIQTAIQQRQAYLKINLQQQLTNLSLSHSQCQSQKNNESIKRLKQNLAASKANININININMYDKLPDKDRDGQQVNFYQNMTVYLRYKLIQGLIKQKSRTDHFRKEIKIKMNSNNQEQNQCKRYENDMEDYYQMLTLINKYVNEVKNKFNFNQPTKSIDFFCSKMLQYEKICQRKIKQGESKLLYLYAKQEQIKYNPFVSSKHRNKSMFEKVKKNKQDQQKSDQKQLYISEKNKARSQSVKIKNIYSQPRSNIKQQLNNLFFKNIQKVHKSQQKSRNTKALLRQRSKSKIMAKILSNTFENAKNALRQIEFQIKTNNHDKPYEQSQVQAPKSTLIKKSKKALKSSCLHPSPSPNLQTPKVSTTEIYQKFNENKKMIANVCKQSLMKQIQQISGLVICNPLSLIQENKKCIIEHRIVHKDYQQMQVYDKDKDKEKDKDKAKEKDKEKDKEKEDDGSDSDQMGYGEIDQKMGFIKLVSGVPNKVCLKIRPKQKNYLLKLYFNPFNSEFQNFSIQISLPKSNNIFTGKYQTIWPTIKYLLRKKILQYPIFKFFKQYETKQCQSKSFSPLCPTSPLPTISPFPSISPNSSSLFQKQKSQKIQQKLQKSIKQQKIVSLFGPIDEQELGQICTTFGFVCKFFDVLLGSRVGLLGRRYDMSDIGNGNGNGGGMGVSGEREGNWSSGNPNRGFGDVKLGILMNSKKEVNVGFNIIKQRGYKFHLFNAFFSLPYFIYSITLDNDSIDKIIHYQSVSNFVPVFSLKISIFYIASITSNCSQVHTQAIEFSPHQSQNYNLSSSIFKQNIQKILLGHKIDKQFQQKLLQISWINFSKRKEFHLPGFFQRNFKQIQKPGESGVWSEAIGQWEHNGMPSINGEEKLKVFENVLEFQLGEMKDNCQYRLNQFDSIKRSQPFINSADAKFKQRIYFGSKIPSITYNIKRKFKSIKQNFEKHCRILRKQMRTKFQNDYENQCQFQYRYKKNKGNLIYCCPYECQSLGKGKLTEIKFLTPFCSVFNWIAEISVIDIQKNCKYRMTLSAQDFYSLGFPFVQDPQQTLKQLSQLSKFLKINKTSLIPKLIIQITSNEQALNLNLNISIDSAYKNSNCQNENDLNASYDKQHNHNNNVHKGHSFNSILKYRSIYLSSKFNKNDFLYFDKPYFQTSGNLSEKKADTVNNIRNAKNGRKRDSDQSMIYPNQNIKKVYDIQDKSFQKYLMKLEEFQWYLSTVPYKFQRDCQKNKCKLKNSLRSAIAFSTISLKYINLHSHTMKQKSLSSKHHISEGLFQIEIKFSQTQYTLISQISQSHLLQSLKDTHEPLLSSFCSFRKVPFSTPFPQGHSLSPHSLQAPLRQKQKQKKPLRRFSIKSKQKAANSINFQSFFHQTERVNFNANAKDSCHSSQRVEIVAYNPRGRDQKKLRKNGEEGQARDKHVFKQFLRSFFVEEMKDNYVKESINLKEAKGKNKSQESDLQSIQQQNKISKIKIDTDFEDSESFGEDYNYRINLKSLPSLSLPAYIRLIHQYDPIRVCIYNIYLYSVNWKIGTSMNSGIGKGVQVQISKISEQDYLQLRKTALKTQSWQQNQMHQKMETKVIKKTKIQTLLKQFQLKYKYQNFQTLHPNPPVANSFSYQHQHPSSNRNKNISINMNMSLGMNMNINKENSFQKNCVLLMELAKYMLYGCASGYGS